jgi:hypothetical protein
MAWSISLGVSVAGDWASSVADNTAQAKNAGTLQLHRQRGAKGIDFILALLGQYTVTKS